MQPWMYWITDTSTWLYIGTQDIWFIFILVLFFTKYGNMKLGKDDEKPEYRYVLIPPFLIIFLTPLCVEIYENLCRNEEMMFCWLCFLGFTEK